MSRKRCNRRIWSTDVDVLERVKWNESKLTAAEWVEQVTPVEACIEALSRGDWDMHAHWQPMFECVNRVESLLRLAKMPANGFIYDIQQVFIVALDRMEKSGVKAFRADELALVRELGRVYGNLLKEVTHKAFHAALARDRANTARIVRSKAFKSDLTTGVLTA